MRKFLFIPAMILALLLLATSISSVTSAPAAITYTSQFQLQNLGIAVANVSIQAYNRSDGLVAATHSITIPASGSFTFAPIGFLSAGFDGSLIVSSDQQLVAIANLQGDPGSSPGFYFDTTPGASAGATAVNLPLLMKGNFGFDTFFNIQNAGGANASGTITYTNGTTQNFSALKPGAAVRFDQSSNGALPAGFVGAATVTSDQPIVASAIQVGQNAGLQFMMGYNGFTTNAGPTVNLPLVMSHNFGYYTAFQVQNTGNASTVVTVVYGAGGGTFAPTNETATIAAGQSATFSQQKSGQWGTGSEAAGDTTKSYVGSATITSSPAQNLAVIVNQHCFTTAAGGYNGAVCPSAVGSSYTGFPGAPGARISAPLIMSANYKYYTALQIQNVGTGTCTSATITYSANTAGTFAPIVETATSLAVGGSQTFLHRGGQWEAFPFSSDTPTKLYVGGATIQGTGTGCLLAAIINQQNLNVSGDIFSTYNGFNY